MTLWRLCCMALAPNKARLGHHDDLIKAPVALQRNTGKAGGT